MMSRGYPRIGDEIRVNRPECGEPPRGRVEVLLGTQQLVCWAFDMHRFKVTFSQDFGGAIRMDVEAI